MWVRAGAIGLLLAVCHSTGLAGQDFGSGAVDWSGPHVGASLGAVRNTGRVVLDGAQGNILPDDVDKGLFPRRRSGPEVSPFGSLSFGYDLQSGAFVGGIEADLGLGRLTATHRFERVDPSGNFAGVDTNSRWTTRIDNLSSLRLRGGYAAGATLFYATGGVAVGRVTNRYTLDLPNLDEAPIAPFVGGLDPFRETWSSRSTRFGFIVGAGVERRIGPALGVRGEVLHYDLRDATVRARGDGLFDGEGLDYRFVNRGQVARIGVTFRF